MNMEHGALVEVGTRAAMVAVVRLKLGGFEQAAATLRELEMQAMLLERRCQQGEGMRSRQDSKLDMAWVRSRQAQLAC